MAEALIFMGVLGLVSGCSQGATAVKQQQAINDQVCQLTDSMSAYSEASKDQDELIKLQAVALRNSLNTTMQAVSNLNRTALQQQNTFRNTYSTFLVVGIVFVLILLVLFTARKVITLRARGLAAREMAAGFEPTGLLEMSA